MAKIRVEGEAILKVRFSVELPMSEEAFDALSEWAQNKLLDDHIDWKNECRGAELDDISIDDLEEIES
ncbi:hypothetical protein M4D57_18760 [Brevibacillus borstelensis]|uniref:hypothetical protein n=1 Tax=Brevibacillus borstelensis TaxID=45462 RepID=UPI00203E7D3F|nr:hypothetical protein [Brevibacillus borstelensis]MCM3560610.1 hypothetical protein [Brevibacillus borstelensis]